MTGTSALASLVWYVLVAASATTARTAEQEEAEAILRMASFSGGVIAQVGIGDGRLTAALAAGSNALVQGLDADQRTVATARRYLSHQGLYGRASVVHWTGGRLPYADGIVNLLVVAEAGRLPRDEMLRALAPAGVACVKEAGHWTRIIRPRPDDLDEWTHWLHGADGNPVAHDRQVGAPAALGRNPPRDRSGTAVSGEHTDRAEDHSADYRPAPPRLLHVKRVWCERRQSQDGPVIAVCAEVTAAGLVNQRLTAEVRLRYADGTPVNASPQGAARYVDKHGRFAAATAKDLQRDDVTWNRWEIPVPVRALRLTGAAGQPLIATVKVTCAGLTSLAEVGLTAAAARPPRLDPAVRVAVVQRSEHVLPEIPGLSPPHPARMGVEGAPKPDQSALFKADYIEMHVEADGLRGQQLVTGVRLRYAEGPAVRATAGAPPVNVDRQGLFRSITVVTLEKDRARRRDLLLNIPHDALDLDPRRGRRLVLVGFARCGGLQAQVERDFVLGATPDKAPGTETPPDAEAERVKAAVAAFIKALQKGDAKAARRLCSGKAADGFAELGNSEASRAASLKHDVRTTTVKGESASAVVWLRNPSFPQHHQEFLLTVDLSRTPEGWRITRLADLTPCLEGLQPKEAGE